MKTAEPIATVQCRFRSWSASSLRSESAASMPHPRSECIREVFANDDALVNVIWALIDAVRGGEDPAFSPDQPRFWDLYNKVEVLYEAVVKRARKLRSTGPCRVS